MRDHCWHMRHLSMLGTDERRQVMRCCHCGAEREVIERATGYDEAHGSHVPVVRWVEQGVLQETIPDCVVERAYGASA